MLCLTLSHWREITELGGYFSKKFFSPTETSPAGETPRVCYLLIAMDFTLFSADAVHLIGKGTLLAAKGLSNTTVSIDVFHANGLGKLSIQKSAIGVSVWYIERKRTVVQMVFTIFAVAR